MTNDFYWPPLDDRERSIARAVRSIACLAYSAIAYVLFLVTIGYFFLFVAGVGAPKTVDSGSSLLGGPAILIDVLLLLGFGLQHSIMARSTAKRRLTRVVPEPLERSTFVLVSALVLLIICWLWRPIPAIVWFVSDGVAVAVRTVGAAGVLLAVASTFALSHSTLFGLQQPYRHVRGRAPAISSLRVPLLYRVVRHPMHLGMLLVIWAAPVMTAGHLLFAVGMSVYVLIGIHFEERDLVRTLGDGYRAYRMEVPALVPFLRPGARRAMRRPAAVAAGIAVIALGLMVLGGARHQGVAWGPKQELQELPRDSVAVRGQMRRFGYYVPSRARAGAPIVIALHGTGGTGERLRRFTGGWLDSLAERHGFVVAYPDAMEGMWNTCRAAESAMASQRGVDDVAMISAVAQRLARRFGGDSTHVYALGYSGGGHLAYRLALEGPEVVRGVAIFAASLPVDAQLACRPSRGAVPVMIVSGTADVINPYEGGAVIGPFGQRLGDVRSAVATAAYFAMRAGADTTDVDVTSGVAVSSRSWVGAGGARVALYTVNGGGHSIPGQHSRFPSLVGPTERSWGGIGEAVRFFGAGGTP